jgi:transposase-like protein/IS1 family transposase
MKKADFNTLTNQLEALSPEQRKAVSAMLTELGRRDRLGELAAVLSNNCSSCPHCGATALYKHGQAHGLPRYRCRVCRKTFNPLTGTPLAHLRLRHKWLSYQQCLLDSLTIRKAAIAVAISRNTSFRWRHRFLAWVKNDRPEKLHGIAEADEMYLLESEKGSRDITRTPRKRGGAASQRGTSKEQVCVLVARDRTGQTLNFVTGRGPVSKAQLRQCLLPALDKDVLLVTDSNSVYRYFARDVDISYESINLRAKRRVRGAIHIQNVNAYHSRCREWLQRFHGVATHYLTNYLGWRWALDANRISAPIDLLRASVGIFPHLAAT